jgi:DNA polymerase-1
MKIAMARADAVLREAGLRARLLLQVHDELVLEAPRDEIATVSRVVSEVMIGAYKLDPPLEVEVKVGTNWRDVE